ncbi:MAG: DUF4325 domain-containing protein [Thermoguttaceae bacterium]|nr:DUF4325 domain-containing protein [Thermoguttaceae bacterium]
MSLSKNQRERVKKYLCEKIDAGDKNYVKKVCATSGLSSTSVYRYLKELVDENVLEKVDAEIPYRLKSERFFFTFFPKKEKLDEINLYRIVREQFPELSEQAKTCWSYAFSAIMNNALEHADAKTIVCEVERNRLYTRVFIGDDGIGIFRNIQRFFKERRGETIDLRDAVAVLFSGKFTTNSLSHAGEGIFFSSQIADEFYIYSDGLVFTRDSCDLNGGQTFEYRREGVLLKTVVVMKIANDSRKETKKIFDKYTETDENGIASFDRTAVPIANMIVDGYPIARSQARRVATNFPKFRKITLDFKGVKEVGQAFVHELFVVFARENPSIQLEYVGANAFVKRTIERVVNASRDA